MKKTRSQPLLLWHQKWTLPKLRFRPISQRMPKTLKRSMLRLTKMTFKSATMTFTISRPSSMMMIYLSMTLVIPMMTSNFFVVPLKPSWHRCRTWTTPMLTQMPTMHHVPYSTAMIMLSPYRTVSSPLPFSITRSFVLINNAIRTSFVSWPRWRKRARRGNEWIPTRIDSIMLD